MMSAVPHVRRRRRRREARSPAMISSSSSLGGGSCLPISARRSSFSRGSARFRAWAGPLRLPLSSPSMTSTLRPRRVARWAGPPVPSGPGYLVNTCSRLDSEATSEDSARRCRLRARVRLGVARGGLGRGRSCRHWVLAAPNTGVMRTTALPFRRDSLRWPCEQPWSARWCGTQASRRPAQGADRQPHGTRCLEGHHASGPQRVHLLGRGCQAGDDPRSPHSPDPGGAGGRPASALLLAGVQTP